MPDITLTPVIKPDSNKLDEAYEVDHDYQARVMNTTIWVPQYFQFDGASIPMAAWQIIGTPFNPKFMRPAVVHDWLYHTHQVDMDDANEIFYRLLKSNDVNPVKATLMYEAVKVGGAWYWDNDDEDKKYLKRLARKLKDAGKDIARYHFPADGS